MGRQYRKNQLASQREWIIDDGSSVTVQNEADLHIIAKRSEAGLGRLDSFYREQSDVFSSVIDADVGDNPLIEGREPWIQKARCECLECLKRCPVKALREEGVDRRRCFTRLRVNLNHAKALAGPGNTTHVCGKCVVGLPCRHRPDL